MHSLGGRDVVIKEEKLSKGGVYKPPRRAKLRVKFGVFISASQKVVEKRGEGNSCTVWVIEQNTRRG